jgi:hypothetical protein
MFGRAGFFSEFAGVGGEALGDGQNGWLRTVCGWSNNMKDFSSSGSGCSISNVNHRCTKFRYASLCRVFIN